MNNLVAGQSNFELSAKKVLLNAENALKEWAILTTGFPVFFGSNTEEKRSVYFSLIAMDEGDRETGGRHFPQLKAHLIYAVHACAVDEQEQRAALFTLFMAVREHAVYQLAEIAIPKERSLPACPPAFAIRVPVVMKRINPSRPRVLEQAEVESIPVLPLEGRILGPGGLPVVRAIVRVPRLNRKAVCNEHGCFRFSAIPVGAPIRLEIEARGSKIEHEVFAKQERFIEIEMNFEDQ